MELIDRPRQLERALMFRDTDLVKVVTGVRRCGKSSLLQLVRRHLEAEGVADRTFVSANLESMELGIRTKEDLHEWCASHMGPGRTYLFIDEMQRIPGWHEAINSLRVSYDCDIYLTGSNAFMLSGELATYLSGRYVEVHLLPLSFGEYAAFCGLAPNARGTAFLGDGDPMPADDLLDVYLRFGGFPAIASRDLTQERHEAYLSSVFETVIVRDILNREANLTERSIRNPDLLRLLCSYLADNVGNPVSSSGIAGALSQTMRVSDKTVTSYITALNDAYAFYPARRYDLRGKAVLRTLPKQYLVDTGLRSFLMGYRNYDAGRVLENAVYLELVRRGGVVYVGKLYGREVDFACVRDGRISYVQVTNDMRDEETMRRELAPLRAIRDNHEKTVVVREGSYPEDVDGIRIVNAARFLLGA